MKGGSLSVNKVTRSSGMIALGWEPFFENGFQSLSDSNLTPGRVIRQLKKTYGVHDGEHLYQAVLGGKFFVKAGTPLALPVVGDWVGFRGDNRKDRVMIREVLPRKSQFVRKVVLENTKPQVIAANVDIVFIVNGLDRDFNLRRIERYLSLTYESGAKPVIILNKIDLCDNPDHAVREVEAVAAGVDVIAVSALTNKGIEQLTPHLKTGVTVAFLGSSGVGKSTLVNLFMGRTVMEVREVRKNDQRGRHTTTHRELFTLPNGSMIIDTPGLRELQLWGSEENLNQTFSDIEKLAESCRFSDCKHEQEPGCAVKSAVEAGEIDEARYANYLKLKKELMNLDRRHNEFGRREIRRQAKVMSKMVKRMVRDHDKRKM
jgi:ribosome biogenesis GTPase